MDASTHPDPPRALVVTVVHHPQDSRIRHREIAALLAAGWQVTYLAPFVGHDLPVPAPDGGLTCIDLPRASGRDRIPAARAARAAVRRLAPEHDVVLVHDPELLPATAGLGLDHLVWDVHEDPAGALVVKDWLPGPLRRPVAGAWRLAERLVEREPRRIGVAVRAYDRQTGDFAVKRARERPHPRFGGEKTVGMQFQLAAQRLPPPTCVLPHPGAMVALTPEGFGMEFRA